MLFSKCCLHVFSSVGGKKVDVVKEQGTTSLHCFLTAFCIWESDTTTGYHAAQISQNLLSRRSPAVQFAYLYSRNNALSTCSAFPMDRYSFLTTVLGKKLWTLATARWFPEISVTSRLGLLKYLLPYKICCCLPGWITAVSGQARNCTHTRMHPGYLPWIFPKL